MGWSWDWALDDRSPDWTAAFVCEGTPEAPPALSHLGPVGEMRGAFEQKGRWELQKRSLVGKCCGMADEESAERRIGAGSVGGAGAVDVDVDVDVDVCRVGYAERERLG